jgi:hypothetical protein
VGSLTFGVIGGVVHRHGFESSPLWGQWCSVLSYHYCIFGGLCWCSALSWVRIFDF